MAPGSRMPVSLSPIITAPEKPHDAERARGGDGGDGRPSPDQYEMQSPYFIVSRPTSTLTTGTESKRHRDDETGACCGIKSRRTRWVLTISIIIVVLVLAVGVPVIYSSKKDKGPAKDSAPQGPSTSHPDELPVILLTLPDNANVAVTASDTSRVAYQDSAGELNVAEYHLGDDYSTAIIDDDYPMTLMAAAKNGTPLAALSYEENQAAIFYVATNNTIQSREGLLAIPELRSTSSLSTLGLGVLPATKIAAVLYPDHFTAALFFQLSNASLVSYHMTNNLWKLDAVLDVDVLEGSYLAAVAYQASGATSAETRLFYQDASDSAIKEICGDGESKGEKWAECRNKSPKMPALKNSSIASVAIAKSSGGISLRTFYHGSGEKATELTEVYYNGTAWAGPRQVPGVELERQSKICAVNPAGTSDTLSTNSFSGQDDDEVAVYFSVGNQLQQIFWRSGEWDTVQEFGAPPGSSTPSASSSASQPSASSSAQPSASSS